jgi:hypothetical protein
MKKKEIEAPETEQVVYVNSKVVSDLTAIVNKYGSKKVQTGVAIIIDRLNKMDYGDFIVVCKKSKKGDNSEEKNNITIQNVTKK